MCGTRGRAVTEAGVDVIERHPGGAGCQGAEALQEGDWEVNRRKSGKRVLNLLACGAGCWDTAWPGLQGRS